MLSSADIFEITVKGKGGHGSMPNDTVDPIMVGAHILTALESINSREIAPDSFGVLTIGWPQGGSKFNIIPDTAFMTGTIRTFDNSVREFMKKRFPPTAARSGLNPAEPSINTKSTPIPGRSSLQLRMKGKRKNTWKSRTIPGLRKARALHSTS